MILVPGVFYLIIGLYFLFRFLRFYFSKKLSLITVFLLFAGTNLFYYGIDEGLMSHVNSFFLFCLFLFLLKKFLIREKKSYGLIVGISFVLSLAILIRPTNILLFSWLIFLDITSVKTLLNRIHIFLRPSYILTFFIVSGIVFFPQLLYWKYLTGHFFFYSYPGETFRNWNNPQILSVWFSPLNSFFLYTPLALSFIIGIIQMIREKQPNGIFIGSIFLVISYLFSSWQCWYFGGSFGYRPFVEYYALLSVPFAYFLGSIKRLKNIYLRSIIVLLIFTSCYYNQRLTWRQSWNASSTWSWDYYLQYLDIAGLYHFPGTTYTFKEDFENHPFYTRNTQFKCVHSPTMAAIVDKNTEFYSIFRRHLATIIKNPVKRISASIWINPGKLKKTDLLVYFVFEDWRHTIYYFQRLNVDEFIKEPDHWTKVNGIIEIPEWLDQNCMCDVGIWNIGQKDAICFDDLILRLE